MCLLIYYFFIYSFIRAFTYSLYLCVCVCISRLIDSQSVLALQWRSLGTTQRHLAVVWMVKS